MPMTEALLYQARKIFHANLLSSILSFDAKGVPSNADGKSTSSVRIAAFIAEKLKAEVGVRAIAQRSGHKFEEIVADYISSTFLMLPQVGLNDWVVERLKGRRRNALASFAQYSHLLALQQAADSNLELAAALGNDYAISPDVVITRKLQADATINKDGLIVSEGVAELSSIRGDISSLPILHASISTKWTLRSDRAQNARSEALNLIRNRKGRQPHITLVTAEPTPGRLSSLALGTGDIDCVYHFALYELIEAVEKHCDAKGKHLLTVMVRGKRLKDISDLPLDLLL